MTLTLGLAVYFIVWWVTLFAVLPWGLRTQGEEGDVVPGTPASAPARPRLLRVFVLNTIIASVLFAVVYLVLANGWIAIEDLSPLG